MVEIINPRIAQITRIIIKLKIKMQKAKSQIKILKYCPWCFV